MKKILTILSALFVFSALAIPFGLEKSKTYRLPPEVQDFRYWFGDVTYGKIFYLGKKDISGFETELHLDFSSSGLVQSATLILGPAGIDSTNCIARYKEVVKLLNDKYGQFKYVREVKDPIVDDLVTDTVCDPVRIEANEIETTWKHKDMTIKATLLGDEEGFYVEVEYIFRAKKKPKELFKLL